MSEHVDLVRSIYADWERGDLLSPWWAHAELEYVVADGPAPGSWTGELHWVEDMRDWLLAWDSYRVELAECREIDDERVLAFTFAAAAAKRAGLTSRPRRREERTCFIAARAR